VSLEARQRNEQVAGVVRTESELDDPSSGHHLASYVLSCWGATFRVAFLMLVLITTVTTIAFGVTVVVAPTASTLLGITAAGSGLLGTYIVVRARRRAAFAAGRDVADRHPEFR
jgi:maltodextrin utilization protein YvdJ